MAKKPAGSADPSALRKALESTPFRFDEYVKSAQKFLYEQRKLERRPDVKVWQGGHRWP